MVARGVGDAKPSALEPEALYLVRPNRIDFPAIAALPDIDFDGDWLSEGASLRWMSRVAAAPAEVVLTGQLWSRPLRHVVRANEAFNRATAGFVFSQDHYYGLSSEEQLKIAMYGRAVSPVTSYLAIEPGVRPSTIGLEAHGLGLGGMMGFGSGSGGARGHSTAVFPMSAIRARIERACHKHGAGIVNLAVDTQDREVADVTASSPLAALARCAEEAMWSETLPFGLIGDHRHTLTIDTRPALP